MALYSSRDSSIKVKVKLKVGLKMVTIRSMSMYSFFLFFLVDYVEERLWWPIQSPNIGGKKKASS